MQVVYLARRRLFSPRPNQPIADPLTSVETNLRSPGTRKPWMTRWAIRLSIPYSSSACLSGRPGACPSKRENVGACGERLARRSSSRDTLSGMRHHARPACCLKLGSDQPLKTSPAASRVQTRTLNAVSGQSLLLCFLLQPYPSPSPPSRRPLR